LYYCTAKVLYKHTTVSTNLTPRIYKLYYINAKNFVPHNSHKRDQKKMGNSIWVMLLSVLVALSSAVAANDIDLLLDFQHSFVDESSQKEGDWVSRGKVKYVVNKSEKKLSVKFENPSFPLSEEDVEKLGRSWMRVRIPAVDSQGNIVPEKYLITSVKGCAIIQDPKEVFSMLTEKSGAVIGIQYDRPTQMDCKPGDVPKKKIDITSKIVASLPKETASLPVPKIDADSLQGPDGKPGAKEAPAQQSIFQQYWYLILPSIVIFQLLTAPQQGEQPPADGQPAAPGAAGTTGASAAGTAVAAAGTAASGNVRRRPQGGK
jgi:hypothetical protein